MNATQIATSLLDIQAVRLNTETPFTWSSGWRSPIYCDNRQILSHPKIRTGVRDAFVETLRQDFADVEAIAGVATGGIALGVLVAEVLELPFAYVRPIPKGHGLRNQIEGRVESGKRMVVIEDLISTGSSSAAAVTALQDVGAVVLGTVAIFGYGFEEAQATFAETGTSFQTLTTLRELLEVAADRNYIAPQDRQKVLAWREQPAQWFSS